MPFQATFIPLHEENLMKSEGDVESARKHFLKDRPRNLEFLLNKRYSWMKKFIDKNSKFIELGSGSGFSKEFLPGENIILTDVTNAPWIDAYADALNLPYPKNSVDGFICSQMIHHIAKPMHFFHQMYEALKPGGHVLILEVHTSFLMRTMIYLMKHEGWDYSKNVFDPLITANQINDPWSGNCAIPELLFSNHKKFQNETGFEIVQDKFSEVFIFPLSGGVIAKAKTIQLPKIVLEIIHKIDQFLVWLSPSFFALGRQVVLRKPA